VVKASGLPGSVEEVTDLIEKQCSAVRSLKPAWLASEGFGERPFLVSEQFALNQIAIDRRAFDGNERLL
jgi:hypothetical protein